MAKKSKPKSNPKRKRVKPTTTPAEKPIINLKARILDQDQPPAIPPVRSKVKSPGKTPVKKATLRSDLEILDLNPPYCYYNNPPGYRYVEAKVTSPEGKVKKGLYLMPNDKIKRIMAHSK